jgi:uncharacterized protein (TIGR03083 family)
MTATPSDQDAQSQPVGPSHEEPDSGTHQLIAQNPDIRADDYVPALWVPLSRLVSARRRLTTMIEQLPSAAWDAPSACPGWTRRDLLAHLVSWDAQHLNSLDAIRAGSPIPSERWLPDPADSAVTQNGWNQREIDHRASTSIADLATTYGAGLTAILDRLTLLNAEQLLHAFGFAANALAAMESHVKHINQHADDIVNGPKMMR